MLFYKSINEMPEDICLESILNEITNEDEDLEGFDYDGEKGETEEKEI